MPGTQQKAATFDGDGHAGTDDGRHHVIRPVAGRPVLVPDEVVQEIRRRLATMAQVEPEDRFRRGDVVHVMRGPFEGLDAVFDRKLSAEGRVRVLLQWISRQVVADLDVEDLLPSY